MHYKNGRQAKVGDMIVTRNYGNAPLAGIVSSISPGTTTCNANIIALPSPGYSVTLSDCLHLDDALPLPEKK